MKKATRSRSFDISRTSALGLGAIAFLMAVGPLLAHHEWPVDRTRRVKMQGTVTALIWANPHVMIALDVDVNGTVEKWKIGGSSPQFMTTCGWSKSSLKPGDVITVIAYRFKDGSRAAQMDTVVMPNGREMFYGAPPRHEAQCRPPARDTPLAD